MIGIIAAMTIDRVIGVYDDGEEIGRIPWDRRKSFLIPDQKRFKEITSDTIVVMGRRTWESIGQKPLPNRENVIISKNIKNTETLDGVYENIKSFIKENKNKNVWFIGGREIYKQAMRFCDTIDITIVPLLSRTLCSQSAVKVYFPSIDEERYDRVGLVHKYNKSLRIIRYERKI